METKTNILTDSEGVKIAPDISGSAPAKKSRFFRKNKSIYADQLVCLCALVGMAVWRSGPRALVICLVSVITAMITDAIGCKMSKKTYNPKDLSTVVSGLCFALMMSAAVSYWLVIFGSALAMGIKHIFGGKDNYIFNPACLSFAFLVICYPSFMLVYPAVGEYLPVFGDLSGYALNSGMESYLLKIGTPQAISSLDVLIGNFIGPIGTVHVLVISVCGLCMMLRRSLSPIVTLAAFGSFLAASFLFPTYDNISMAIIIELISGNLLFGLVFIANDPQTLPKSVLGKFYYGLLIGLLAMAFRHFAKVETSFVFVLLLANAVSVHIDLFADRTIVVTKNLLRYLKKTMTDFERVKKSAQNTNEEERSLNDTQEIIVPLMNYNMPAIDNKVIKAKKSKPKKILKTKDTRGTFFSALRKSFENDEEYIDEGLPNEKRAEKKSHTIFRPKKRSEQKHNKNGKK